MADVDEDQESLVNWPAERPCFLGHKIGLLKRGRVSFEEFSPGALAALWAGTSRQ